MREVLCEWEAAISGASTLSLRLRIGIEHVRTWAEHRCWVAWLMYMLTWMVHALALVMHVRRSVKRGDSSLVKRLWDGDLMARVVCNLLHGQRRNLRLLRQRH